MRSFSKVQAVVAVVVVDDDGVVVVVVAADDVGSTKQQCQRPTTQSATCIDTSQSCPKIFEIPLTVAANAVKPRRDLVMLEKMSG